MAYLIEYEDLTNATPLGGNIDIDRYKFCIEDAQNSKLKEILGDTLYNKIETDYLDEDLSGDYLILYNDFVKPILIHQSAVEYLIIGGYQISNGGIYKHTPANGTPVDQTEIDMLVNHQRLKVEMYVERCLRWLLKVNLPEYQWHYENIVNPQFRNSGFGFDFIGYKTETTQDTWKANDSGDLTDSY